ncbi:hypothetical protein B5M07_11715 [Sulfitobacter sp. D7]|nr:hypothetical protein B5M07_11715 [Sulfitobacter sp. D7]
MLIALVLFAAALQNWYFTLPIGIFCAYFFGYRAAVVGVILATITVLLIQVETREALEARNALRKECVTKLVSDTATIQYGKPVEELNIIDRLRVNRAIKKGSLTLIKTYEEGGIRAVEVFITEEEFVAEHSIQKFIDQMKDCTGEN